MGKIISFYKSFFKTKKFNLMIKYLFAFSFIFFASCRPGYLDISESYYDEKQAEEIIRLSSIYSNESSPKNKGSSSPRPSNLISSELQNKIKISENYYSISKIPVIEPVNEPEVRKMIGFMLKNRRKFLVQSALRRDKYHPLMRSVFRKKGLPEELIEIALIESGYIPTAKSPGGAVGVWQFISSTAKAYGLKVGVFKDERKDVIKSTLAAANYLSDLYDQFDDWNLTVAAYNAGPGTIRKAIREGNSRNFFHLVRQGHFKKEVQEYLPKFLATVYIMNNRKRFSI